MNFKILNLSSFCKPSNQGFVFFIFWMLFIAKSSFGGAVDPDNLLPVAVHNRESHLREVSEVFYPGYNAYLKVESFYEPIPGYVNMKTPYGELKGYPYRQHLGIMLSNPIEKSDYDIGLLYMYDRQGWDSEDFILVPPKHRFARGWSIHSAGVLLSDTLNKASAGLGGTWLINHYNPVHGSKQVDSLFSWGRFYWKRTDLYASWNHHSNQWAQVGLGLKLQARQLRDEPSSGWQTFLPDMHYVWHNREDLQHELRVQQNLYDQRLYLKARTFGDSLQNHYGILSWNFDQAHLFGIDLSLNHQKKEYFAGFSAHLTFFTVSYSHPEAMEAYLPMRGVWFFGVSFNLNTRHRGKDDMDFFGRGAARPAELATEKINSPKKVGNVDDDPIVGGEMGAAPK
jgi:hypothetical protein